MQTQRYRIRNWNQYNRALIQRVSLTVWIDEGSVKNGCRCPLLARQEELKPIQTMLSKIPGQLKSVRGDGAYDGSSLRKEAYSKGAKMIVPPPRNAVYKGIADGWERERDASLAEIEGLGGDEEGRKLWKKLTGYHRRSLVETAMFRVKKMIGNGLKARSLEAQSTEAHCKCLVINKMNTLGLPEGHWVSEAA